MNKMAKQLRKKTHRRTKRRAKIKIKWEYSADESEENKQCPSEITAWLPKPKSGNRKPPKNFIKCECCRYGP